MPHLATLMTSWKLLCNHTVQTGTRNQEKYVEVWVEKDALSGVLEPIVDEYHVPLMVNRGYSSVSAMHDAAPEV